MGRLKQYAIDHDLLVPVPDWPDEQPAEERSDEAPAVSEKDLEAAGQLRMAVWDDEREQAA